MNIEWSLREEDQLIYYCLCARGVQNGFYQNIRSIVLPYLHPDGWFLPDYGLFENGAFKKKLENVNRGIFAVKDTSLLDLVNEKFDLNLSEHEVVSDRKAFEKIQDAFFETYETVLPESTFIRSLTIVPTKFGTGSSYFVDEKHPDHMSITYRIDGSYQRVLQSLLSLFVKHALETDEENTDKWKIRKGMSDFLVAHTIFEKFFDESQKHKVLDFLDDYKGELLEDSAKYFDKMGYPLSASFTYKDTTIFFNEKSILGLSGKEVEIMKLLIDKKREVVSFDDLADLYWKENPDDYSLQALVKVMQRLRYTLSENGIAESYLRTVRKRGYLLFD